MKYLLIIIILFQLRNIQSINSTLLTRCSTFLCESNREKCPQLDTNCQCSSTQIQCPTLITGSISYESSTSVNSLLLKGNTNLTAYHQLLTMTYNLSIQYLAIVETCSESLTECANHLNTTYKEFPIEEIPAITTVEGLLLRNNCLNNIKGNFTKQFPELMQLILDDNRFTQFPYSIATVKLLQELSMARNFLQDLQRSDFQFKFLAKLTLSNNCITALSEDLLYDLPSLEELNIDSNAISSIPNSLLQHNTNLVRFNISQNSLKEIPATIFYSNQQLKFIDLSYNALTNLPEDMLKNVRNMDTIFLNNNKIASIPALFLYDSGQISVRFAHNLLTEIPYLRRKLGYSGNLDFRYNNITVLHLPIVRKIPRANDVYLSGNCIKKLDFNKSYLSDSYTIHVFECNNCCLGTIDPFMFNGIAYVNFSENNISHFDASFWDYRNFMGIDCSNNKIELLNMSGLNDSFLNNIHIPDDVYLRNNPINCDCHLIPLINYLHANANNGKKFFPFIQTVCQSPPEVKNKSLKDLIGAQLYCNYPDCPNNCTCLVQDLQHPKYILVNCSFSNLTQFPNLDTYSSKNLILSLDHNFIETLPATKSIIWNHIISLDISNNLITSLTNLTISPTLKNLNLHNNLLTKLEKPLFDLMGTDIKITLTNNSWQCVCELRKLILKTSINENKNVTCIKNNQKYTLDELDVFCVSTDLYYLWIILPLTLLIVLITTSIALFYKFKPEILYFLFSRGLCLSCVLEDDVGTNKTFDAFMSYSSEDETWVNEVLVKGLESCVPPYKLCVHGRDWIGGVLITDQIIKSVESSRRTIMVLTDGYLASHWSRMEFDVAYQQTLHDHTHRLIVVFPDDIPDLSKIDKEYKTFIELTTYLEFKKPYFWRKLRSSMPRTRQPPRAGKKDQVGRDNQTFEMK